MNEQMSFDEMNLLRRKCFFMYLSSGAVIAFSILLAVFTMTMVFCILGILAGVIIIVIASKKRQRTAKAIPARPLILKVVSLLSNILRKPPMYVLPPKSSILLRDSGKDTTPRLTPKTFPSTKPSRSLPKALLMPSIY